MNEWAPKRFWKQAEPSVLETGFTVLLDGRNVRTPAKAQLIVPTRALAEAIAEEWQAQKDRVDPGTMPCMRSANAAIDKVAAQHAEVADMLAAYADSDLLCYRAEHPAELVQRQKTSWDPLLDWADDTFWARLLPRAGVIHAAQDPAALEKLAYQVQEMDDFALAAFHDLVSLTGSLVLGLAAIHAVRVPAEIWDLSRIDESWQEEQWGFDEEATQTANRKRGEFLHAVRFYQLSR